MNLAAKYFRKYLMNHAGLRVSVRRLHVRLKESRYRRLSRGIELDEKMIIFETFMGRQYGCNPKAIYEYMIGDSCFDDFKFIWVLNDESKAAEIPGFTSKIQGYGRDAARSRVKIVSLRSDDYYRAYAKAKYVVTNSNLDYGISKKPGQVFLQTWHGTPLKKLRCDIEIESGNALNSLAEINQKNDLDVVRYDYFISPSRYASEKFTSSFNLEKLGKKDIIIETGYPRNDLLFNFDEEYAKSIKKKLGIPEDKKVILYAPTFRDNQHDGAGYTYDTHIDFDRLQSELANNIGETKASRYDYVILFRAHYFVASQFDFSKYEGFIYDVSGLDDITPLYTIADILITDYSSVFFDFANLKRPMIFYMYDLEEYATGIRGFYIDVKELPGPIAKTEDELIDEIKKLSKSSDAFSLTNKGKCRVAETYADKYEAFNNKYNYLDDGKAAKRVVDILIGSN